MSWLSRLAHHQRCCQGWLQRSTRQGKGNSGPGDKRKKGWPPNFTLFVRKAYREFSPVKSPLKVVNRLPANTAPSRAEARIALTTICANISLLQYIYHKRETKRKDPKEISKLL